MVAEPNQRWDIVNPITRAVGIMAAQLITNALMKLDSIK